MANINPIRYRSYYYDKEIGLYYLNNRYYDPEIMRFISLDDISYLEYDVLGGLNLWTYCNNNPIMYVDPDGNDWDSFWSGFWKVVGVISIIGVITVASVLTFGGAAIALGLGTAVASSIMVGAAIGGVVAGGIELGMQIATRGIDNMSLGSIAIETFTGAALGAIAGASASTTSVSLRI